MQDKEEFEIQEEYRKYVLEIFSYYWNKYTKEQLEYIFKNLVYTDDLAIVTEAIEEF